MDSKNLNQALIVSITPYFLEKGAVWFQENLDKVLQAQKTQVFFQDNILFLEKGEDYALFEILRKLDEMGYEKVFEVSEPGEFSQRGGVLDVSPINTKNAIRLDFLGNKIENILELPAHVEDEEKSREILKKRLKSQKIFSDIKGIKSVDYLVHLDHGIGKFVGISDNFYILEYAEGDKLYVPVGLEKKLSRYVGFSDPRISRLGSALWFKTKKKAKEEIEKLAKELLQLYAKKETSLRQPYQFDAGLETELQATFPYQETPDQLQAMEDIKADLQKEKPMDRLICGDVGFGKTEIAIRTALISASNNRQTAIICPTTILASQHFENFKKRLEKLAVNVQVLTRLQSQKEQKKIIKNTADGKVDILIGTHRILSKDIVFKNLQLLIIDDEQRFGVKQKEKLRGINPSLDILYLSATPIPRTIYLAMSSFKGATLIQTPPEGRLSVKTYIKKFNKALVKKAVETELSRGGQVYYLHNRVQTIYKAEKFLQDLIPGVKISVLHGRLPESQIIKTMREFEQKKYDVLLATTIIENGIDLPKVNTIIIEEATRLGLSQAYQIKGRVGRSHIQGHAYLFYSPKNLTLLAKERLLALKKAGELGSGYHIAIKDLELRGAGNILGKEQSGSVNKIGLNLYCQILSEAVEKLRS